MLRFGYVGYLPTEQALGIVKSGTARLRVKRAGMLQYVVFAVKRIKLGADEFAELYSNRVIDFGELQRLADETGLPVEASNGRAFPKGLGAKDFIGI